MVRTYNDSIMISTVTLYVFMLHIDTGTTMCQNGEIRLVGGESEREGQVEMCYNGVWGTVCANGWDEVTANITCSQLGSSLGNYNSGFGLMLYY